MIHMNAKHIGIEYSCDKCNFKWLRIKMSYHKFSNLGQLLQGDLNSKLSNEVTPLDFENLKYNRNLKT